MKLKSEAPCSNSSSAISKIIIIPENIWQPKNIFWHQKHCKRLTNLKNKSVICFPCFDYLILSFSHCIYCTLVRRLSFWRWSSILLYFSNFRSIGNTELSMLYDFIIGIKISFSVIKLVVFRELLCLFQKSLVLRNLLRILNDTLYSFHEVRWLSFCLPCLADNPYYIIHSSLIAKRHIA